MRDKLTKSGVVNLTSLTEQDSVSNIRDWVSTQSLALDRALRLPGLPCGRITEIYGRNHSGKAQPLSAMVHTPLGFVPIGTLKVGDEITDPTGGVQTVTGVFPQGVRDVFRVETNDGAATLCCAEHLWRVWTFVDMKEGNGGRVLSTAEMAAHGLRKTRKSRAWAFRLPKTAPVAGHTDPLPLSPYLLGLLLGDGNLSGTCITFNKPEPDLWAALNSALPDEDTVTPISSTSTRFGVRIIRKIRGKEKSETWQRLCSLGLLGKESHQKFIPAPYLTADAVSRVALLRGLIDTDGHVNTERGACIEYSTSSWQLARQVRQLVWSLGGLCALNEKIPTYKYKGEKRTGRTSYRMHIRFSDISPFVGSVKHRAKLLPRKENAYRSITKISSVGAMECVCIRVSAPHSLYITDDFVVTHNSTLLAHFFAEVQRRGGLTYCLDQEATLDKDYLSRIGVDISALEMIEIKKGPRTIEAGAQAIQDLLLTLSAYPDVLVGVGWDTIASAASRRELEEPLKAQQPGYQAKEIKAMCRRATAVLPGTKIALVVLNQSYTKIGPAYGDPEVANGGEGLKFYASVRIKVTGPAKLPDGVEGSLSKAKIIKSKLSGASGSVAELALARGHGVDNTYTLYQVLDEHKLITTGGGGARSIRLSETEEIKWRGGWPGLHDLCAKEPAVYARLVDAFLALTKTKSVPESPTEEVEDDGEE